MALTKREILIQKCELMTIKIERLKQNKAVNFFQKGYDWQHDYWKAGATCKQRLVQAGNQVGKTEPVCAEIAYHATGRYPENWQGYKFNKRNLEIYCMAKTIDKAKTILQKRTIGMYETGEMTGGFIYKDDIIHSTKVLGQNGQNIKSIKIRHINGSFTILTFASYEQGQDVLMGEILDLIAIDEEPRDRRIYGQAVTRTMNGDNKRGGLLMLSFTPEFGYTELVAQFAERLGAKQYFKNVSWAEAPHLTEEVKTQMREAIPTHELPAREFGLARMGSGMVYTTAEERLHMTDEDQLLDHFPRLCSIDFGALHTVVGWQAWDTDRDIWYLYDMIYCNDESVEQIARKIIDRGSWIPLVYPHDGHSKKQAEKGLGKSLIKQYKDAGITTIDTNVTDESGTISVAAGIKRLDDREKSGKLKVNRNLVKWFEERRQYHRKDGVIVKMKDHSMDMTRYGEMGKRFAITKPVVNNNPINVINTKMNYITTGDV